MKPLPCTATDWAQCRVPLITQFYGAFQDAYQIFLVMEYCAGGDLLDRLLDEGRAMSERRVILEVAVPLLKTLQHLHSYSIIHRCAGRPAITTPWPALPLRGQVTRVDQPYPPV